MAQWVPAPAHRGRRVRPLTMVDTGLSDLLEELEEDGRPSSIQECLDDNGNLDTAKYLLYSQKREEIDELEDQLDAVAWGDDDGGGVRKEEARMRDLERQANVGATNPTTYNRGVSVKDKHSCAVLKQKGVREKARNVCELLAINCQDNVNTLAQLAQFTGMLKDARENDRDEDAEFFYSQQKATFVELSTINKRKLALEKESDKLIAEGNKKRRKVEQAGFSSPYPSTITTATQKTVSSVGGQSSVSPQATTNEVFVVDGPEAPTQDQRNIIKSVLDDTTSDIGLDSEEEEAAKKQREEEYLEQEKHKEPEQIVEECNRELKEVALAEVATKLAEAEVAAKEKRKAEHIAMCNQLTKDNGGLQGKDAQNY